MRTRRTFTRGSRLAAAATLAVALVGTGFVVSSPATAADAAPCAEAVTSAPTGPATVSVATRGSYGKVLVVGAGRYAGCSLYLLTSDQLHTLTGADYACPGTASVLGPPCDTVLWPALLSDGAPIAGPGVNSALLGTVTRTDVLSGMSVQQVTYAGQPLYRFLFDEQPGETEGAKLFDPVTSPTGTWYLVHPSRGLPAPGRAEIGLETAPINGNGPYATVLSVSMDDSFSAFADASFPVYTLNTDRKHATACPALCAQSWPPVLTDSRPRASAGVDQHALGVFVRADGTQQVTYHGKPLYQFVGDAYIGGGVGVGTVGIRGAGVTSPWGVFNTPSLG